MYISKASAQQIVQEMGRLFQQTIELTDEYGRIAASSVPGRAGGIHEGAAHLLQEGLQILPLRSEQAVVVAIEVNGQRYGAVCVTGDMALLQAQTVQKMAEIFIRDRISMDTRQLDMRIRSRFLEDWVLGDGLATPQSLSERGYAIGIDIQVPRRCIVLSVRHLEAYTNSLAGQKRIEQLESVIDSQLSAASDCIILRNAGRQILLLHRRSTEELATLCRRLTDLVREQLNLPLVCGIDGSAGDIHLAYLQANRAWRMASHGSQSVIRYEDLNAELVLDYVPRSRKSEFLRKIFSGCTAEEIRDNVVLLEAYFAAEGSLQQAADRLFIHKNTLQYRLKRLAELTGLDVRKPSNAPALYLAMHFFLELEADQTDLSI